MLILKGSMRLIFIVALLFFLSGLLMAQPISRDLKLDWQMYSADNQKYSIYNSDNDEAPIHIFVAINKFQGQFLRIKASGVGSIFINESLVHHTESDALPASVVLWNIDSISEGKNSKNLHIVILGYTEIDETVIIPNALNSNHQSGVDTIRVENRTVNDFSDETVLALFIVFIFLLLLKLAKPKGFQNFFDFKAAFSARSRNNVFYESRVLESQSLLFYFFYASLIIFFIFYNFSSLIGVASSSSSLFIFQRLSLALIAVFFILPMKNIWLTLLSSLFDLGYIKRVQYFDNFRLGLALLLLLTGLSIIQKHYFAQFGTTIFLSSIVIIALIVRASFLFIKLLKITSVKRIYLFSYLCVTELIPLFFVIKVLKSTNY